MALSSSELKKCAIEAANYALTCDYTQAFALYDKILSQTTFITTKEVTSDIELILDTFFKKSQILIQMVQLNSASNYANEILNFLQNFPSYTLGFGYAYWIQARIAIYSNKYTEATLITNKLLALITEEFLEAQPIHKSIMLSLGYSLQGRIAYLQGEYDQAEHFDQKCLTEARLSNNDSAVTSALNGLGNLHSALGNYTEAVNYYLEALKLSKNQQDVANQSLTQSNLAIVYQSLGNYDLALQNNLEALKLREAHSLNVFPTLDNIGHLYGEIGEYELAGNYFSRALAYAKDKNLDAEYGYALGRFAKLQFIQGLYSRAKEFYIESFKYYNKSGIEDELVANYCNYAELLTIIGECTDAEDKLEQALIFAKKHNSKREMYLYQYTKALLEKAFENFGNSKRLLHKLLQTTPNYFEIHINVNLLLAEFAFETFQRSQQPNDFEATSKFLHTAAQMCQTAHLYPRLIQTKMIHARLFAANFNFVDALKQLEEAKKYSHEYNLTSLADRVNAILDQITDQITTVEVSDQTHSLVKKMAMENALEQMYNERYKRDISLRRNFQHDSFFFVAFKHGDLGPEVILTEKLPFENTERILFSIGVFYSTAIGQGNRHHQGLFGPLPLVDQNNYSSIVYAKILGDKTARDPRMKGMTYCLFCIFYDNRFAELFYDRRIITESFEKKLADIDDIKKLSLEFVSDLKSLLFSRITQI